MWASAPTGARGRAGDHKGRPYVLGPPSVPVGAAFMAARFCQSPRGRSGNTHGSGRMWATAPTGVRGRADVHKVSPHALGPPGAPVGAAVVAARPNPGAGTGPAPAILRVSFRLLNNVGADAHIGPPIRPQIDRGRVWAPAPTALQ